MLDSSALTDVHSASNRQRLADWNDTTAPFPANSCIHELIEERVALSPDSVAVTCSDSFLTYRQLNESANRLARHLRTLGVGPDRRVAICTERSLEMVVGLLAILKAGGAYVPLDPGYPPGRLSHMLIDSAPWVVLSHAPARAVLTVAMRDAQQKPVVLDLLSDESWVDQSDDNIDCVEMGLSSQNLAYVIYTSGSTGVPKGVMIEHQAIVNRLCGMQDAYRLDDSDAVLQKTPFSFDVSVWEFLWTLMTGARLVMARPEGHRDPMYLRRLIQDERITTLHFVPSMLHLFLCDREVADCKTLRRVFCSGEALQDSALRQMSNTLPQVCLYNLYGPTEAAVDVTAWAWNRGEAVVTGRPPPIGRPIWNTQIHILGHDGNPVPIGAEGEIYIGGTGVARGYLNQPDLTAERFVANPFATGKRLYRTGDLGRYLSNGNIEYLGRNDHQIKLNGLRIELGEIESRLLQHPQISGAVVVALDLAPGDKRLVAYYTVMDGMEVGLQEIKLHLLDTLAKHMLPSAFIELTQLPLTLNGKLDRAALPVPERKAYDTRAAAR